MSKARVPRYAALIVFVISSTAAVVLVRIDPSGALVQITVFTGIAIACAVVLGIPVREALRDLLNGRKQQTHVNKEHDSDSTPDTKQELHLPPPTEPNERETVNLLLARATLRKFEAQLESSRYRGLLIRAIIELGKKQLEESQDDE